MDYLPKAKELLADLLGVNPDQVTPEANLVDDLGCDSLDVVEVVMSFEEEFDITITDQEAERCKTVGDILLLVDRHLAQ